MLFLQQPNFVPTQPPISEMLFWEIGYEIARRKKKLSMMKFIQVIYLIKFEFKSILFLFNKL